ATAATPAHTLSLHDALPICVLAQVLFVRPAHSTKGHASLLEVRFIRELGKDALGEIRLHVEKADIAIVEDDFQGVVGQRLDVRRSEEHTSEVQSRENLVCRL